ncbi:MAG: acyltransferase [Gordonia paraffinivorans]
MSRDRRAARDPGPADVIAGALTDWRPALGELVWWTPDDEDAARAAGVVSEVGPSFLQRDHLLSAHARRASGGPHRAVVTVTTEVDEPLDDGAMARALTDFTRTHDELRSRFVVDDSGVITRLLTPPEIIAVRTRREPAPPDHAALVDVLHRRIDRDATHDRIPGWSVGAVDAGSSFALHVTFDHSHTDGSAAIEALQEIVVRYRAHVTGTEPVLRPAGSHLDHVTDELRRAATVTPDDPLVRRWRDVLVAHGRTVPRTALDIGLDGPDPAPAVAIDEPLVDATTAAACESRARSAGGSLSAALFAAIARAQWHVTGEPRYFTSTVLSTRDPAFPGTQGWMCTFAPIALQADAGEPDDLVRGAAEQLRHARAHIDRPVHGVLAVLAASGDFVPDASSPQMVSYLDFRKLADPRAPEIVAGRVMPGVGRTRNANLWINRNDDGLRLLSHVPDNAVARRSIAALHASLVAELTSYARVQRPVRYAEHVGAQVP